MRMKNIIIYISLILLLVNISYSKEKAVVITIDGGISPSTSLYIESGIKHADKENAELLVIMLDTPGGLLESTRDIVSDILESPVPIAVFVAPSGSRAGSAGVFITLAGHVSAMAPGTNIGAAHPVGIGGESGDSSSVMFDKVTNDAAAFIRSIAEKRKKNIDWAEKAVRESISATETEALENGVIDFICPNIDSLMILIDGMIVETTKGEKTLETKNIEIEMLDMNWREELLSIISDPNIAYILLMLGMYGLLFELYSPGSIFPGVIGGISILLGLYSLQMLPINYAGLGLIILAIILFIIEVKVQSYGLLSIGGVISLFLGSVMLIDAPYEFMDISMSVIITIVVLTVLFFGGLAFLGLKAQTRKRASGREGITGEAGVALTDISPNLPGKAKVHGEIWKAVADHEIKAGEEIVVASISGLTVNVTKK
jgi:membrane-bound serine protease (ClpP class)